MAENKALQLFQSAVGKSAAQYSPSPFGRWLDGKLLMVTEGHSQWEFAVREEMTNPGKVLHGGVIAAIIDEVMGATVFTLGRPEFHTTINLSIDYLASAKANDVLSVESKVIRKGNTIVNVEATITIEGRLIAKASSNLMKLQKK